MTDTKKFVVKAAVINAMHETGMLAEGGFRLHKGFVGEYEVSECLPAKTAKARVAKGPDNTFRLATHGASGAVSIAGYYFSNAILVPKGTDLGMTPIREDRPGIFFKEEAALTTAGFNTLHSKYIPKGSAFTVPKHFKIVGALINHDQETLGAGKGLVPAVALNQYPGYGALLAFHRISNPEAKWLSRIEIDYYVEMVNAGVAAERPALPKDYKFALPNEEVRWSYKTMNFTLLIEDWS